MISIETGGLNNIRALWLTRLQIETRHFIMYDFLKVMHQFIIISSYLQDIGALCMGTMVYVILTIHSCSITMLCFGIVTTQNVLLQTWVANEKYNVCQKSCPQAGFKSVPPASEAGALNRCYQHVWRFSIEMYGTTKSAASPIRNWILRSLLAISFYVHV